MAADSSTSCTRSWATATLTHLPVERRDLGKVEELVGGESLRGRTGGAVTLAVGMALHLHRGASHWIGLRGRGHA